MKGRRVKNIQRISDDREEIYSFKSARFLRRNYTRNLRRKSTGIFSLHLMTRARRLYIFKKWAKSVRLIEIYRLIDIGRYSKFKKALRAKLGRGITCAKIFRHVILQFTPFSQIPLALRKNYKGIRRR